MKSAKAVGLVLPGVVVRSRIELIGGRHERSYSY